MLKAVIRSCLLGLIALSVSACATVFRSDVSTFHDGPPSAGKSFAIVPMDAEKRDSIEYAQYAALLVGELERVGYKALEPDSTAKPDLVVGFDIVQSEGREQIFSRPGLNAGWFGAGPYWGWAPFYGGWGFGGRGGLWGPGFGGGLNRELDARTIYPTTLFVEFRTTDGELSFEGRAITDARNRAINNTIPLLARSLFTGYPGPEGGSRHVRLTLDEDGQVTKESVKDIDLNDRQGRYGR